MAKPSVKTRRVHMSVLDRLTDGFKAFLDGLVQLVENGDDWGATNIIIRFFNEEDVPCMSVIDNGQGMNQRGREAYTVLADSCAREDVHKKGRNGTGRCGCINHCKESMAISRTADGESFEITLTRENMFEAWFVNGGNPLLWRSIDLPYGHELKTSGTIITWRDLRTGSSQAYAQRKPQKVIDNLAERLSPHLAPKIQVQIVSDEGNVEKHSLKPRKIHGSPIVGTHTSIQAPGDLHWELFVVTKSHSGTDHVMIGAMGPVCTWSEFVSSALRDDRYRDLAKQIDVILRHPQVVGHIDIPSLNADYATNDRKSFSADLLNSEEIMIAVLEALRLHVVPQVENELGLRTDQIVTTDDNELVRQICADIHNITGTRPIKKTVAHIELNRHRLDMQPGDTFVFRVEKPDLNLRYVWDDSRSGGSLDRKTGPEVTFTAKSLGRGHKLEVRTMGDVSQAPISRITINILEKVPMRFIRPTVSMGWNDRALVRLENVPESASLNWEHQDWNGSLNINDGLSEAEVFSAEQNGDFDITVINNDDPDDEAVCTIRVLEQYGKRTRKTSSIDDEFELRGQKFRLIPTKMRGTPDALANVSWAVAGQDISTITLNFGHPLFMAENDSARCNASKREICLRASELILGGSSAKATEIHALAAELTAELLGSQ